MGITLENLLSKALGVSKSREKINRERFIESFKDDIIVIKTGGDNDGNYMDKGVILNK